MVSVTLQQAIERARHHQMTPEERHRQRVSLAMGLRSKDSSMTREDAEAAVDYMNGSGRAPARHKGE